MWIADISLHSVYTEEKKWNYAKLVKKEKCNKIIVITQQDNLTTIKCIEYEKDKDKIQGYKKPLECTAKFSKSVMGLYNPSWD